MARARLNSGNAQAEELPKAKINKDSIKQVMRLFPGFIMPYLFKHQFVFVSFVDGKINWYRSPGGTGR